MSGSRLRRFFSRSKAQPIDWDCTYGANTYDGVGDRFQWTRYSVLAGIVRRAGHSRILDIGCGYGGLRDFLPSFDSYTGLDISGVPLKGLARDEREQFICADIESWNPVGTYDAIVLSEVLYYVKDTDATLAKLQACLAPTGVIAASFFLHPRSNPNRVATQKTREFLHGFGEFQEFNIVTGVPTWTIMYSLRRRA